jgi:hypothetical protein
MVQLLYLSVGRIGDDEAIPTPLREALVKTAEVETWQELTALRDRHYQSVKDSFALLIGQKT